MDVILLPLQIVALTKGASISCMNVGLSILTTSHITTCWLLCVNILTCTWKEMAQIMPSATKVR